MMARFTRHGGAGRCDFCGKEYADLTPITRDDSDKEYRVCDVPCSDSIRDTPEHFSRVMNVLAP